MDYVIMIVFVLGANSGNPMPEDIFLGEGQNWTLSQCEAVYESARKEFLKFPDLQFDQARSGCITDNRRRTLDY